MAQAKRNLKYSILDVFSTQRYKGNPLSVVYTDGDLALQEYENIAREFGYSETSFIYYSPGRKALQVRSFSPTGFEVDGAGHNLLGAVLAALIKGMNIFQEQTGDPYVIMKQAAIPLFIQQNETAIPVVQMQQRPASAGKEIDVAIIAPALGIAPPDISANSFPPTIVQTEVAHCMIHVNDVSVLNKINTDNKSLIAISKQYGFEGYYAFALTPEKDHVAESRFFNPLIGIEEDAATGTAAGPLAGILQSKRLINKNESYQILQGVQLNQPSLIEVKVTDKGVLVGGTAVITMEGELSL
ncbi:MAG TPA: PhzF family phenazine biosynthesis protein [Chitinophagaceae bacterium]|jgi:trans-2,3-dihydro-3-hydroxyanthranilate isomerase|nr:PhzF family phenazine biosynthesis protein [Chitinophagaceae bacterium]